MIVLSQTPAQYYTSNVFSISSYRIFHSSIVIVQAKIVYHLVGVFVGVHLFFIVAVFITKSAWRTVNCFEAEITKLSLKAAPCNKVKGSCRFTFLQGAFRHNSYHKQKLDVVAPLMTGLPPTSSTILPI